MGHRVIEIHEAVQGENDKLAAQNREKFEYHGTLVVNMMSSPGSGKTAFLARTLADMRSRVTIGVIVGDLATDNDAQRLDDKGADIVQITTGGYCHLDAGMIAKALQKIYLDDLCLLFIENVGNLVCPASFDLGEDFRVALLSVTEGEDKPLKYPTLYKSAEVVVITKMDLAEAAEFNRELAIENICKINPKATIFEVSSKTGVGMEKWYNFLEGRVTCVNPWAGG